MLILFIAEPTSAEWVPLLFKYGPSALVVFFVTVILIMRPRSGNPRMDTVISSLLWLCLICLVAVTVIAWWRMSFPGEYVAKGTISTLRSPAFIDTMETMFLHKKPKAGRDFEYEWRYISNDKGPHQVELLLQSDPKSPQVYKYLFEVRESFYDGVPVDIVLDKQLSMSLKHGSELVTIPPETGLVYYSDPNINRFTFVPIVSAAEQRTSPQELVSALDADDPVIRAAAKRDLISSGVQALTSLSQALQSNSYRLKVEALSTLGAMNSDLVNQLPDSVRCLIMSIGDDPDKLLQTGVALLSKNGMAIPVSCRCTMVRLAEKRSLRFARGTEPIYVYLVRQHNRKPDAADFLVSDMNPNSISSGIEQGLMERVGAKPESTKKVSIVDRNTAEVNIDGYLYSLSIHTHYVQGRVELKTCPVPKQN